MSMTKRYYVLTLRTEVCTTCKAIAAQVNAEGGRWFSEEDVLKGLSGYGRTGLFHDGCQCALIPSNDGVPLHTIEEMESLRKGFLFHQAVQNLPEETVENLRRLYG